MTTDRDAMIQAICTDPRCDSRRLVFADYLEECGEEDRSSFIRVQVELARIPYCSSCAPGEGTVTDYDCGHDEERAKLRRRERELLKLCWTPYFQHLFPKPHGIEVGTLTMRWGGRIEAEPARGFIHSVSLPWGGDNGWLRHAPALFWHEKQTVECRSSAHVNWKAQCVIEGCVNGRIPKPFPATAQPLEEVRLTTWPPFGAGGLLFTFSTCQTCGGSGTWEDGNPPYVGQCPTCKGVPVNKWYCDEWPGLVFRMPEGGA